jgi:SAM-dependent methyltransferase
LPVSGRVLDIACGKAELLIRVARRWRCSSVGVDISPPFVAESRARASAAELAVVPEIIEGNGGEYDGEPGSFDAAVCLGASWIWGGLPGTLRALSAWSKPGGLVVVGEPFWIRDPSPEYLEAAGLEASSFSTHDGNAHIGLDEGLGFLRAIASTPDDWDRYEGLISCAAERYAVDHSSDPDVPDVIATVRKARDRYLRWGRDELGWAVYVFMKDPYTPQSAQ